MNTRNISLIYRVQGDDFTLKEVKRDKRSFH